MQSKTSFFNKTLYKKNLTRFAPLWGLYTLCLLFGVLLLSAGQGDLYPFVHDLVATLHQLMPVVNLLYAPLAAVLLFGDLNNARMCNALHAMPIRREGYFLTNVLSGLTFSALPTAVMALVCMPMLAASVYRNAWGVGILFFLGTNLQYLCFFGLAALCVFLSGSRYVSLAIYGVLNCLSWVVYTIVDTLYTPMLYGVVTPNTLAALLCPINGMTDRYIKVQSPDALRMLLEKQGTKAVGTWEILGENWVGLCIWAAVGVGLLTAALFLYRRRDLECAGDALAFKVLEPVLLTVGAIGGAYLSFSVFVLFFGLGTTGTFLVYGTILLGLAVGWFACRMVIARSTRVFAPRNWLGLLALTAVLAATQGATYFDIFRIDDYIPRADRVESAVVQADYSRDRTYEDPDDIQTILRLQELALQDRLDSWEYYDLNGEPLLRQPVSVTYDEKTGMVLTEEPEPILVPCRKAGHLRIEYTLKSGKVVTRQYYVWGDGETGDLVRALNSDWDTFLARNFYRYEKEDDEFTLDHLESVQMYGSEENVIPQEYWSREHVQALLDAARADCEAGDLIQANAFHPGHFLLTDVEDPRPREYMVVSIQTKEGGFEFSFYADSANVLKWFSDRGIEAFTVHPETVWRQ